MKLQIAAYVGEFEDVVLMEQNIQPVDNWERVLRKMYNWVWKHCDQDNVIDLFAIMINEDGWHECAQAWAIEYSRNYPDYDVPFM